MKILIIDEYTPELITDLEKLPLEITYIPLADREEVERLIPAYDILMLNSKVDVDKKLIDLAPKLGLVLRSGIGLDHIDVPCLEEKGIKLRNTPGANANAVGEQAVGMLLSLMHCITRADKSVKQFEWPRAVNRGDEIGNKTVGIIGFGNTGQSVGKKLSGFDCEILAYDKYKQGFGTERIKEVSIEEIMAKADIVTFHVPLTGETRYWGNEQFFEALAKPIVLLNLARGPVVKLSALVDAMDKGKVKAAALDVLENEKLHTLNDTEKQLYQNLFQRDNVILTPHIGGWSFQSRQNIRKQMLASIEEHLREKRIV